jgi:hypothetical protein
MADMFIKLKKKILSKSVKSTLSPEFTFALYSMGPDFLVQSWKSYLEHDEKIAEICPNVYKIV